MPDAAALTLAEIEATRELIAPHVLKTPLHLWKGIEIDGRVGADTDVCIKLELFQYTGTFKARGAMSNILRLAPEQLERGVTAVSAGNHAVAVAFAAHKLGVSAKVVMMSTANPARVARAEAYGAEVILAGDGKACFALAQEIELQEGRAFIHPFDGRNTALGTATLGLEWSEQAGPLDAVTHGGDFAADRLSDRDHGIAGRAFRLGEPDRHLGHRLRDHAQFLAAPGEAGEEVEQQHRCEKQGDQAGEREGTAAALTDGGL